MKIPMALRSLPPHLHILLITLVLAACNEPDMGKFPVGTTDTCRAQSPFIQKIGLTQPVAIDSRQWGYQGLRLISMKDQQIWQHPSWDDVGHVGTFARDRAGNIYVAPVPNVSLSEAVLQGLPNQLYRIDAKSGEMALFMAMPAVAKPSTANPFGIMGLYYDCDTDSLYVSSLAGSTVNEVHGRIYQLDLQQKKVISQLEKTDALSILIYNGVRHKRLYLGSARSPDIYSVALDSKGNFTTDIRHELSLANIPGGNTSNARKLSVAKDQQGRYVLTIKEKEFGFRLLAENNLQKQVYRFVYRPGTDRWQYLDRKPEF